MRCEDTREEKAPGRREGRLVQRPWGGVGPAVSVAAATAGLRHRAE